jgi:hypothetical protein
MARARLPWCALLLLCFGCAAGSGAAVSPNDVLRSYAQALREQRLDDAYALLSREAQARVSLAVFRQMAQENPKEIEEISADLLRPSEAARVTATLTTADGDTLLLVYEGERWKIDASALDLYRQDSPLAALSSFLRAFDHKRYDVLLRFVPEAQAEGLSPEALQAAWEGEQRTHMERLTQSLKASLANAKVEMLGDRATVGYGAGGTVELINEHGSWKIEDF